VYSIVSLISAWVRQFYLPNPFATILDPSYATIFNILVGGAILHILSYGITSIYYRRGSNYVLGCISYLFWYVINTFIFIGVGLIIHTLSMYVLSLIVIYVLLTILIGYIFHNSY
jgi:hypothetical protein